MITHKKPVKMHFLYYSAVAAVLLEYSAAIFFMMTLAQNTTTIFIGLLIAMVISTYTLTMWDAVAGFWHKNIFISLFVVVSLNIPAFIYDVHGFIGVMSELNSEFELNSEAAKKESKFIDSQLKSTAKFELDTNSVLTEINELTAKNNKLASEIKSFISQKSKCKLSYGTCVANLDERISANNVAIFDNKQTILTLNNSMSVFGTVVKAESEKQKNINSLLAGANDNKKAHEAFKTISNWLYGDINHAKKLQANILTFSSVFLAALSMMLPFLATQLCFDNVETEIKSDDQNDSTGIIERLNRLRMPSPTPAQTTAFLNTQQSEQENLESVFQRGHTQKLSDAPQTEKSNPIGFTWETPIAIDKRFKNEIDKKDIDRIKDAENAIAHAVKMNKNNTVSTLLSTPISTLSSTKGRSKGRGRSAGLEYSVIKDAVKDGSYFKFRGTCSIRNLVDYVKSISPNGTGISKDTASYYMTLLKEDMLPLSHTEWERKNANHE